MKRASTKEVLPAIGAAFEGGHFAGRIRIDGTLYAIIVPPKAHSEHAATIWNASNKRVAGASSFHDGLANTQAMAKAGSAIAKWALERELYIPARDELELLYRAFKPSKYLNTSFSGDNPSSEPIGYAYAPKFPAQTTVKEFRGSGTEAFAENWYWSSTQYAGYGEYAWCQGFSHGFQLNRPKSAQLRVRAVRRLPIE